ncbi:MAG: ATP-binding cassette domain-containing protein [Deltaproteobacteria bacterium]|nr:ATP-binding cassette domain-containing protein [Deltaproteobacteria bacterium]
MSSGKDSTRDYAVEVSGLSTRFGDRVVHQKIDLNLVRGEILALVGGSGSGKSTLLREILLLQRPAGGAIKLFGREIDSTAESELRRLRPRMGVLFQNGALISSLNIFDNVALPLKEHSHLSPPFIFELALRKIVLVGLAPETGYLFPSQLSGGMRKRAGLARALALDPEILFLDEPTSGLDPVSAEDFDELLLKLHDSLDLTVLMVSHDLNSLWRLAHRIAVLGEGRILALGAKEEVAGSDNPLVNSFFRGARGLAARRMNGEI